MTTKLIPREAHDRFDRGDWSSERLVLVRFGTKELQWWKSGKVWADRIIGYHSFEPSLITMDTSDRQCNYKTIAKGGRMSKSLFASKRQEIADFFGVDISDQINTKMTLVIES